MSNKLSQAIRDSMERLSDKERSALSERLAVAPLRLAMQPMWRRLMATPSVWRKHYAIDRRFFGRWQAAIWATRWTCILLFPGAWSLDENKEQA